MSETTQLRPCPFCGDDAIKPARRHGFPVQAECLNCGAEGPSKLTAREADQAWNDAVSSLSNALGKNGYGSKKGFH